MYNGLVDVSSVKGGFLNKKSDWLLVFTNSQPLFSNQNYLSNSIFFNSEQS